MRNAQGGTGGEIGRDPAKPGIVEFHRNHMRIGITPRRGIKKPRAEARGISFQMQRNC